MDRTHTRDGILSVNTHEIRCTSFNGLIRRVFVYLTNCNNENPFVRKIVTESQEFARVAGTKKKMTIIGNDQMFFIFMVVAVVVVSFCLAYYVDSFILFYRDFSSRNVETNNMFGDITPFVLLFTISFVAITMWFVVLLCVNCLISNEAIMLFGRRAKGVKGRWPKLVKWKSERRNLDLTGNCSVAFDTLTH